MGSSGEIAAYAVRSGLLTDPVPLVEEYVSRIVAFDIAMGRDGLLKRWSQNCSRVVVVLLFLALAPLLYVSRLSFMFVGSICRSPEGGYGLKEWLDDAEESQSTIPDNEAEQSDSVGQKHLPGRSLDPRPMYSMLEGQSWQSTSNNSRYLEHQMIHTAFPCMIWRVWNIHTHMCTGNCWKSQVQHKILYQRSCVNVLWSEANQFQTVWMF